MADPTPPDPPPVLSPTVADLLAVHPTLFRDGAGRWSAPGDPKSVADAHVVEAIAAGTAFSVQVNDLGKPIAITATAGKVLTPAMVGTVEAATVKV